eukprot:TRINITY_DN6794_c0_g2_i1.p1 TRINITY_DN6794_c0_g2~~TRINITY_DN6794_c0_g2_i1.p1  ORF type:complete len:180 (+),score=23.41 TRINITY_DN6794_c0_g2_i1:64-603(+)
MSRCRSNSCPPIYTDNEGLQAVARDCVSVPGDFDTDLKDLDIFFDEPTKQEHGDQAAYQVAALLAELETLKAKNLELDASIGVLTPLPGQPANISQRGLNPRAAPFRLGGANDSDSDRVEAPPSAYWSQRVSRTRGSLSGSSAGMTPESSFCGETYPMYNSDWWSASEWDRCGHGGLYM